MGKFSDSEHLLRLGGVFLIGALAVVLARSILVPPTFGQYGHYRGNAIQEMAARPAAFAGHRTCELCHADVLEIKNKGVHKGVNCEACHGPLAKHVEHPGSVQPAKLETASLCVSCHEANGARPKAFPQIVAKDHDSAELPCKACHRPHSPSLTSGGKP